MLPLSPGVPERVRLRAGTNLVLRLTVPDDLPKGQAYRVQLGTNSGEIVWTTEVVMPELGGPVSVSLPADATAPQAYILRFMSSDSIDSAPQATYSYEISR